MKNRYIAFLFILAGIFSACNKFLDVKPKGIIIPEKVEDYENILNSPTLTKTFPINLLDFTDDNFNAIDYINQNPTANGYYWRPILTTNEKASPDVWGPLYHAIYDCNVIISGVVNTSDGTAAKKQSVLAQMSFIRTSLRVILWTRTLYQCLSFKLKNYTTTIMTTIRLTKKT